MTKQAVEALEKRLGWSLAQYMDAKGKVAAANVALDSHTVLSGASYLEARALLEVYEREERHWRGYYLGYKSALEDMKYQEDMDKRYSDGMQDEKAKRNDLREN